MKVELFYMPGCGACVARNDELRAAAREAVKDLEWHETNVLDNVDRAVEFGVMTLPSIVIDGEVVFTSAPTAAQLRKALIARNGNRT
jgi:thioredoxin 1